MALGTPAHEFRELDNAELDKRLADAKEELFNLRFQKATGQLTNNLFCVSVNLVFPSFRKLRHKHE